MLIGILTRIHIQIIGIIILIHVRILFCNNTNTCKIVQILFFKTFSNDLQYVITIEEIFSRAFTDFDIA